MIRPDRTYYILDEPTATDGRIQGLNWRVSMDEQRFVKPDEARAVARELGGLLLGEHRRVLDRSITATQDVEGAYARHGLHMWVFYTRPTQLHDSIYDYPDLCNAMPRTLMLHSLLASRLKKPLPRFIVNALEPGGVVDAHADDAIDTNVCMLGEGITRIKDAGDDKIREFALGPGDVVEFTNPEEISQRAVHSSHNLGPGMRFALIA